MSHLTRRNRPTAARAVAQLQQLPQVQRQTRFLWETSEITTVRAAIRTIAVCQLVDEPSDPPLSRLSHSSSSSHRGHVSTEITVGDAGGHDGSDSSVSVSK